MTAAMAPTITINAGSGLIICAPTSNSNNIVNTDNVYFLEMVTALPQWLHGFEDAEPRNNFCHDDRQAWWQCGHKCCIYPFA